MSRGLFTLPGGPIPDRGPIPQDRRMLFRIGSNLGDILIEGDDILGGGHFGPSRQLSRLLVRVRLRADVPVKRRRRLCVACDGRRGGSCGGWRFLSSAEGLRCSVDGFSRQHGSMGLAVSMVFFSSDEPECCGAGRALRALDRARAGIQFPRSASDHFAAR
jgi:hypothetical protein